MQKLLYTVLMATRKLLHYFTDHEVAVVTSYPLGDIIRKRDAAGRISKWALKLMGHGIWYIPRTAIKSQALMDFMLNGQRCSYRPRTLPTSTGQCTSTGP